MAVCFVARILRLSIVDCARLFEKKSRAETSVSSFRKKENFLFFFLPHRIRFARFQLGIVAEFAF